MCEIYLDCRASSLLQFETALEKGYLAEKEGRKITCHLDFGFFNDLAFPLFDPLQTAAHRLAIDEFMKELWPKFASLTEALFLYRGPLETPVDFFLFGDYCNLLADFFKEELPLAIDLIASESPLQIACKTTPEIWGRFILLINGNPLPYRSVDQGKAIVIPPKNRWNDAVLYALEKGVQELSPQLRFVYEPFLTSEWEGVEELFLAKDSLFPDTERLIAGFKAAEGKVTFLQ